MIRRARSFFRDSEAGVAVTVGVVGGLALYYVLSAIGQGLVIGYIEHRTRAGQLLLTEFTIAGVTFNYQLFVGPAAALALIAVLAYVLSSGPVASRWPTTAAPATARSARARSGPMPGDARTARRW